MKVYDRLVDVHTASEVLGFNPYTLTKMAEQYSNMPKVYITWFAGEPSALMFPIADLKLWIKYNSSVFQEYILEGKGTTGIYKFETRSMNREVKNLMKELGLKRMAVKSYRGNGTF